MDDEDLLEEEDERSETAELSTLIRKNQNNLSSLSGGDSMAYLEFKKVYMRKKRQ
jgi:hypothetical protein